MSLGFWKKLGKPIFVLAPMADVTDAAFRRIIAEVGKPDVMWTEFVSADGLMLASEVGRKKLLKCLEYSEGERPIVAQFFTSSPEHMREATRLACEFGFDGVDINMGCPDRGVERQGAGASLMRNVALARELVRSAKEGARVSGGINGQLPISVKIRTGYSRPELENWLPEILEEEPAVVTVHARTRNEMSKFPARWEFVKRAVEIRNTSGKETLILGNGDVKDIDDAKRKCEEFGCDGVMLGRAIFGNPWLFSGYIPLVQERLRVLVAHTKLFEELLGGWNNFAIMKKHFKAYVNEFDGAGYLRGQLMQANNASEVERLVNNFILYLHHEKV